MDELDRILDEQQSGGLYNPSSLAEQLLANAAPPADQFVDDASASDDSAALPEHASGGPSNAPSGAAANHLLLARIQAATARLSSTEQCAAMAMACAADDDTGGPDPLSAPSATTSATASAPAPPLASSTAIPWYSSKGVATADPLPAHADLADDAVRLAPFDSHTDAFPRHSHLPPEAALADHDNGDDERGGDIAAVIFDLDGTLLDTEPLSTEAINLALADIQRDLGGSELGSHQTPMLVEWELKRELIGLRDAEWAAKVLDHFGLAALGVSPHLLVDGWHRHLHSLLPHAAALPGAHALVDALVKRGIPIALATSSTAAAVAVKRSNAAHAAMFAAFGAAIVCGDDARVARGKPAPDIFLCAAALLGVRPAQCLVVEDSPAGARVCLCVDECFNAQMFNVPST
jgi:pseudouridine-5'-monophosphatase